MEFGWRKGGMSSQEIISRSYLKRTAINFSGHCYPFFLMSPLNIILTLEWCGDAYKVAIEQNNSPYANVITWNKDFGVTIITKETTTPQSYGISYSDLTKNNFEAVNCQPLGVITSFLETLRTFQIDEDLDRAEEEITSFDIESIDIKEYYKLCFPDRRIGRKKEETLIKELKNGGFEV